jgi:hypothetical protein
VAQLRDMAKAAIAERRRPGLSALDAALQREGVFRWIVPSGKLKAGTKAFLAYNTRNGPFSWSNEAQLHFGYDGWYNEDKQVGGGGVGRFKERPPVLQVFWCLGLASFHTQGFGWISRCNDPSFLPPTTNPDPPPRPLCPSLHLNLTPRSSA